MKIYTGIGSRKTPSHILKKMRMYANTFADIGLTLRSGGAEGADTAFEVGCDKGRGKKEIFLPWKSFNHNPSPLYHIPLDAYELAEELYGSRWMYAKQGVHKFMARNVQQILGQYLEEPTDFVVCFTPDGCTSDTTRTRKTGGTGQAISCASRFTVPVFNLNGGEAALLQFLKENFT